MKFARYVARILVYTAWKFGSNSCCHCWDTKFFSRGLFFWRTLYMYSTGSLQRHKWILPLLAFQCAENVPFLLRYKFSECFRLHNVSLLHVGELFCAITATIGGIAGMIIYILSYVPFLYFGADDHYRALSAEAKCGLSLVPNLAMGIGCKILVHFETAGVFELITVIL